MLLTSSKVYFIFNIVFLNCKFYLCFFFFLCFCFSHVYSARSMEGGIWERGGLEKEQTRVLDGPLRGSARVGQVEFK